MLCARQVTLFDARLQKQAAHTYLCNALKADNRLVAAVFASGLPLAQTYASALGDVAAQVMCVEPHNTPSHETLQNLLVAVQLRDIFDTDVRHRLVVVCDPSPDTQTQYYLANDISGNNQFAMLVTKS